MGDHAESAAPACVVEFMGTFMLVFVVGCNVITGQAVWGVTSIACTLMVWIYAVGSISGAHLNPAVSFALWICGKLDSGKMLNYVVLQLCGGIAGGIAYGLLFWEVFNLAPAPGYGFFQCVFAEFFYTFMLCFVVLNVAASKYHKEDGNQYFGMAIAFCVVAGGYGAGHISGGCFNPAVAWGIDVSSISVGLGWCFVYTVFELAGAGVAAVLFMACRPEEKDDDFEEEPEWQRSWEYPQSAKLLSEFLGTYFLVLTVGLNVIGKSKAPVWSIGSSLMCMIYALGSVSGAHFNPAVTVAVFLRGAISRRNAGWYVATQLLAGVCGGLTYGRLAAPFGHWFESFPLGPGPGYGWAEVAFAEILFTFLLAFVVLSVATVKEQKQLPQFFGLAIGACVMAGGYAIGAVSGGSLNPAVSLGISASHILGGGHFWHCLLYSIFEICGAAMAAGAFVVAHGDEFR